MPPKNWCSIHARCSKSSLKHSIRFCGIFPGSKQNFIAYRFSKVSDYIFEIHQLWQWGFSRVYSNCCCSCSFEPEILKIGQSSYTMCSNNIVNFQESTKLIAYIETYRIYRNLSHISRTYIYIYIYIYIPKFISLYIYLFILYVCLRLFMCARRRQTDRDREFCNILCQSTQLTWSLSKKNAIIPTWR